MNESQSFTVNGRAVEVQGHEAGSLLGALRDELGLTGAKPGCGIGACGACTVQLDGRTVRACRTTLAQVSGRHVLTVEGLAQADRLHPLQQAFIDHGALQCGYCTPAMLVTAHALLAETPHPTREQIVARMNGVLCRCGAHLRIIAAIESVAQRSTGNP